MTVRNIWRQTQKNELRLHRLKWWRQRVYSWQGNQTLRLNVNSSDQLARTVGTGELQCGQPTRPTDIKSKHRNDNDDRYLILETTGICYYTGYQLAPYLPGSSCGELDSGANWQWDELTKSLRENSQPVDSVYSKDCSNEQ